MLACEDWASKNKMIFNIHKCGVISDQDIEVTLNGSPLPVVSTYKYLGFPIQTNGICWTQFRGQQLTKARNLFYQFKTIGNLWSPKVKLTMYKIFLRQEYGLGLYANTKATDEISNQERLLFQEICQWIVSSGAPNSSIRAVIGLEDPTFRKSHLQAKYALHCQRLPLDCTLKRLKTATSLMDVLGNRRCIIRACFSHPWATQFQEYNKINTNQMSWLTFITNQWYLENTQVTQSYISRQSRLPNRMDKTLLIQDDHQRHQALMWRLNTWCWHAKLKCECGRTLTRRCIEHILDPEDLLNETQLMQYYSSQQYHPDKYCILDFLLNREEFEKFSVCLNMLKENN
jgi:hypothetical protein